MSSSRSKEINRGYHLCDWYVKEMSDNVKNMAWHYNVIVMWSIPPYFVFCVFGQAIFVLLEFLVVVAFRLSFVLFPFFCFALLCCLLLHFSSSIMSRKLVRDIQHLIGNPVYLHNVSRIHVRYAKLGAGQSGARYLFYTDHKHTTNQLSTTVLSSIPRTPTPHNRLCNHIQQHTTCQ